MYFQLTSSDEKENLTDVTHWPESYLPWMMNPVTEVSEPRSVCKKMYKSITRRYRCRYTGADPGFSNRGGAKDYVHAEHIPSAKCEVQSPLKGPGSSRVLDTLSCYLSPILTHSGIKLDKNMVGQNLEGVRACCASDWIRTGYIVICSFGRNLNLETWRQFHATVTPSRKAFPHEPLKPIFLEK